MESNQSLNESMSILKVNVEVNSKEPLKSIEKPIGINKAKKGYLISGTNADNQNVSVRTSLLPFGGIYLH